LEVLARGAQVQKKDNPATRGRTGSRQGALESAGRGESNGVGFEESASLKRSAGRKSGIPQQADVQQSREGSHWSRLAEGNRMVQVSERPHGYSGQQADKGRYLTQH